MDPSDDELDSARLAAGLTHEQLWWRCFALGGMAPALEVEAVLARALLAEDADRDLIVLALNEARLEQGDERRLPCSDE